MMDLFKIFDPLTPYYSPLNWLVLAPLFMIPLNPWYNPSIPCLMTKIIINYLKVQFKNSLNKFTWSNLMIIMSLMTLIMMLNLSGLIPFSFPRTSHMSNNFSMALMMWLSTMLYKIINLNKMMSHLTPKNTPSILIPFMIMIETISIMIQPLALGIRLTANITAGHIIMTLISELYDYTYMITLLMHMIMMTLEISMAIIQAYVFTMLVTLYCK